VREKAIYNATYKDRLTSFNGSSIAYNQQGCPTTYLGKTLTWAYGRLTKVVKGTLATGIETCTYTYNAKGQLIQTYYTYLPGQQTLIEYETSRRTTLKYAEDGRMVNEKIVVTYNTGVSKNIDTVYLYDESGICGCRMTVDGTTYNYYYRKNVQGDVVGIYDLLGNEVVKYAYDAYGNCTVTTGAATNIGGYNHITYRGYYYEQNLGMYWLQTRFYDANTGRFISPDPTEYLDTDTIHGVNLYAYCNDCPTMFADPSGHFPALLAFVLIGAAVGAVSYVASEAVSAAISGEWNWSWGQFIGSTLGGALGGLATGLGAGPFLSGFISGASSSIIGMGLDNVIEGTDYSISEITASAIFNGLVSGGLAYFGSEMVSIDGVTAGRNSLKAIGKQMVTKMKRHLIKNLSPKTIGKLILYNAYISLYDMSKMSLNNIIGARDILLDVFV